MYDNGFEEGNEYRVELDKAGLKNSIYDYLNGYRDTRGVGVITDSQSIFYTQFLDKSYDKTHDNIATNIEDIIHHQRDGKFYENHVYVFAILDYFCINFPSNGMLSLNQYKYLCDILDQVNKYNSETTDDKKIHIDFMAENNTYDKFIQEFEKEQDISKIKERLRSLITHDIHLDEEVIIGKKLSDEELTESMLFHMGLKNTMSLDEIRLMLKMCVQYFSNKNYRDMFLKIFPNYENVSSLVELLFRIDEAGIGILSNFSFNNMYDIIKNSGAIKNGIIRAFDGNMDYNTIRNVFNNISSIKDHNLLIELFPNFDFAYECIDGVKLDSSEIEKINSLLINSKTYNDKVSVIVNFIHEKLDSDIFEKEQEVAEINKKYEYLFTGKKIIANKEKINSMIAKYNDMKKECDKYNDSIGDINFSIEMNEGSSRNYTNKLNSYSKSFWKKIFGIGIIRDCKKNIERLNGTINDLKEQKMKYISEQDNIRHSLDQIEGEFKEITGLSYMVKNVEYMNYYYYNRDYTPDEKYYNETLEKNNMELLELKKKLDIINQSGLVKDNEISNIKK